MAKKHTTASCRDDSIETIRNVLAPYRDAHPKAKLDVRRQNNVSIRIRIIDPDFKGMARVDREPEVWTLLDALPDGVVSDITMLLLLEPGETKNSLANMEFDHPIPSRI